MQGDFKKEEGGGGHPSLTQGSAVVADAESWAVGRERLILGPRSGVVRQGSS